MCSHGGVRTRTDPRDRARGGDARVLHGLRDERHHQPRAARYPRRAQARAATHPLGDARHRDDCRRALPEVRRGRRRSPRQVPPPRRHRRLRHAGPAGPALGDALSADRRAGQLRVGRRRSARRLPVHRGAHDRRGDEPGRRHREGYGRLRPELRQRAWRARAARDAVAASQPAHQRRERHRGGHGDQHPAAQPRRGVRRRDPPHRRSRDRHRGSHPHRQGTGLSHRRHHLHARYRQRLRHRARTHRHARPGRLRGVEVTAASRSSSASFPTR